jgi:2',3'-cyclic-nucleotide 2'-phosphodiesterase (5'-nucleotidase family)
MPASDRPDVIVAGHRHAWMLGRVRGVPIVSSDQHGVGLARIRYCRASSSAPPVLERIERRVAMAASPPSSALGVRVASVVLPWQAKVKAEADAIVATLPRTCVANALNGTAMAEQTARAIAEHATVALPAPRGVPIVAIMNSGGIRAPLHAGPVRYRDLFTASPFENGVAVCATTRAGLARAIANALHRPSVREHFPFGIAGAKVTMKRGADGDLTLVRLDVEKSAAVPKDDDPIWLAIPDFILWGGDGLLDGVTCTSAPSSPVRVRDVWRAVLAREQMCDGAPRNIAIDAR